MIRNVLLITLAIASTAAAQEFSPYISLSGGGTFLEVSGRPNGASVDAEGGGILEGAVGIAYKDYVDTPALRAELALSSQTDVFDDYEDVETKAVMVNGYLDLFTETDFTPYFLAGVGRANVDDGSYNFDTLAYQLGGGVGYSITEHVILDLKYKYFATTDHELNGVNIRTATHQVQFGVRYQF